MNLLWRLGLGVMSRGKFVPSQCPACCTPGGTDPPIFVCPTGHTCYYVAQLCHGQPNPGNKVILVDTVCFSNSIGNTGGRCVGGKKAGLCWFLTANAATRGITEEEAAALYGSRAEYITCPTLPEILHDRFLCCECLPGCDITTGAGNVQCCCSCEQGGRIDWSLNYIQTHATDLDPGWNGCITTVTIAGSGTFVWSLAADCVSGTSGPDQVLHRRDTVVCHGVVVSDESQTIGIPANKFLSFLGSGVPYPRCGVGGVGGICWGQGAVFGYDGCSPPQPGSGSTIRCPDRGDDCSGDPRNVCSCQANEGGCYGTSIQGTSVIYSGDQSSPREQSSASVSVGVTPTGRCGGGCESANNRNPRVFPIRPLDLPAL